MSNSIRELISSMRAHPLARPIRRNKKAKARSSKIIKRRPIYVDDNEFNIGEIMDQLEVNVNRISLSVSDFEDLITTKILQKRVEAGNVTVHRETTVLANRKTWADWVESAFDDLQFVQGRSSGLGSVSSGFIIDEETDNYITYYVNSNSTTVRCEISGMHHCLQEP